MNDELNTKDQLAGELRIMDRESMERVSELFFTTKGPDEGTGIGPAAVHGIVKRHGGTVSVPSEPGNAAAPASSYPG